MSALSSALDNMVISQTGENGSTEYGWGKNVQELITQFQFQLVRNTSNYTFKSIPPGLLTLPRPTFCRGLAV